VSNGWGDPVSAVEAARRAGGRRRYNNWRQTLALLRRAKLVRLLAAQGGLARRRDGWPDWRVGLWGNQGALARRLGVSPATVCRDLHKLRAEICPSPPCGAGVRPPGPGAKAGDEDHPGLVDEILAGMEEAVARAGWAGPGAAPSRVRRRRREGPHPLRDRAGRGGSLAGATVRPTARRRKSRPPAAALGTALGPGVAPDVRTLPYQDAARGASQGAKRPLIAR
jgi:hypothetical protein